MGKETKYFCDRCKKEVLTSGYLKIAGYQYNGAIRDLELCESCNVLYGEMIKNFINKNNSGEVNG
jgi:hypothetical protein